MEFSKYRTSYKISIVLILILIPVLSLSYLLYTLGCAAPQKKKVDDCTSFFKPKPLGWKLFNDYPTLKALDSDSSTIDSKKVRWKKLPIKWRFSCSFPIEFLEEVRKSFLFWDDLTKTKLFEEVPCSQSEYDPETITINHRDRYHRCGKQTLGQAWTPISAGNIDGSRIILWKSWKEISSDRRYILVIHEIGHALGMKHVPERSCIMYPYITDNTGCSKELEEFKKVYGD